MQHKKEVQAKLDEIDQYLQELEEFLPADEDEYLENRQARRACEKTIELIIECVINILSKIVSHNRYGLPKSEDDILTITVQKKILPAELAKTIRQMKGFRNLLVHRYTEVDDHIAYENISKHLDDFTQFEQEIGKYLKGLKKGLRELKKAQPFQKEVGKL